MKCPSCGWENIDAARYCNNCGGQLGKEAPEESPAAAAEGAKSGLAQRLVEALRALGIVAVLMAAIFFVGMSWGRLSDALRITAVFLFMAVPFGVGILLRSATNMKKTGNGLILLGSLVLPLFLLTVAVQLGWETALGGDRLGLFVSGFVTVVYIWIAYLIERPVFAVLYAISSLEFYHYLLKITVSPLARPEHYIPVGLAFLAIAYFNQRIKKLDFARFLYVFAATLLIGPTLAVALGAGRPTSLYGWELIALVECVAIIALSIVVKVKTLFITGIVFLVLDLILLYARLNENRRGMMSVDLLVIGVLLIGGAILLERNRSNVRAAFSEWS